MHAWGNIPKNEFNQTDNENLIGERYTSATIFFLFLSFILGALVRQLLKKFSLPYTVVLFLIGTVLGTISSKHPELQEYTLMTRLYPSSLLQMFLPILIFESAFSMDAHMFLKAFSQCIILAVPGLVICALLTAVFAKHVLSVYNWGWITSLTFGTILSATDPVAVVALLKEVGVSPSLTTIIDGESLLNDGSAIVIFEVLIGIMTSNADIKAMNIFMTFIRISLGGPVFGYFMGKITIMCLNVVYNDAIVEITITFSAAYLTYTVADSLLHISGVLAVVALGVVVSAGKSSISPAIEESLHNFWEMLSYLANTLIFIIVGIIITEIATKGLTNQDCFLIIATYLAVTAFRILMIGFLSPILMRLGYGLEWRHAVVLTWGGLRGAVGLALSLLLMYNPEVDNPTIAGKILIQVSGIVVLTLVINGATMRFLLKILGLQSISPAKSYEMAHAVHHLRHIAKRSTRVQKMDKFLASANWIWVAGHTHISDPYNEGEETEAFGWDFKTPRALKCPECDHTQEVVPTLEELNEMNEEARGRIITALKICYYKQFELGLVTRDSVRTLVSLACEAEDHIGEYMSMQALRKHMYVNPCLAFIIKFLRRLGTKVHADSFKVTPSYLTDMYNETTGCRQLMLRIYMHSWFLPIICLTLVLNIIPITVQFSIPTDIDKNHDAAAAMMAVNFMFVCIYLGEMVIKQISLGLKSYFSSAWNCFDCAVVAICIIDTTMDITIVIYHWTSMEYLAIVRLFRLLRLLRMLRLGKMILVKLLVFFNDKLSGQMYSVLDLLHGFIIGQEEIIKKVDLLIDYMPIAQSCRKSAEECVLTALKYMTEIQKSYPGIALALKSHLACRTILNDIRTTLEELMEEGLVGEVEYEKLFQQVDEMIQEVIHAPRYMPPSLKIEDILRKVDWITDERLSRKILANYIVKDYRVGQVIHDIGNYPNAVQIITSGIVKITGAEDGTQDGTLANSDSILYFRSRGKFREFLSTCQTLGLMGFLTNTPFVTTAFCETAVEVIYITNATLAAAELEMVERPTLSYILWRVIALKVSAYLMAKQSKYHGWTAEKLKLRLENAILPDLIHTVSLPISELIEDIILVQGEACDDAKDSIYVGPVYISTAVKILRFPEDPEDRRRPIIVLVAPDNYSVSPQMDWSGIDSKTDRANLCLLHTIQRRQTIQENSENSSNASMPIKSHPKKRGKRGKPEDTVALKRSR